MTQYKVQKKNENGKFEDVGASFQLFSRAKQEKAYKETNTPGEYRIVETSWEVVG